MKSSDIKRLRKEVVARFGNPGGTLFPKKGRVEKIQISNDETVYFVDETLLLLKIDEDYIPSLFSIYARKFELPSVYVDQGAVKAFLNGADMMVPGITKCDPFSEDDVITVNEEVKNKPIGIGKALMSSDEIKNATHGKAVKNLHYIRDKYFEIAGI
jgi:PUA domain protein